MPKKDNNESANFRPYQNKKSRLKKQDIEEDYKDLGKSSDIRSYGRNN